MTDNACKVADKRNECGWADEGALCATHEPGVSVVRILPEVEHERMVAAPARTSRREVFYLSGRPAPLRGYRIA